MGDSASNGRIHPEIRPAVPKVRQKDRCDPHQRTIPRRGDGCIVPDSPSSTGPAKRLHGLADPKDLPLGEFLREQLGYKATFILEQMLKRPKGKLSIVRW